MYANFCYVNWPTQTIVRACCFSCQNYLSVKTFCQKVEDKMCVQVMVEVAIPAPVSASTLPRDDMKFWIIWSNGLRVLRWFGWSVQILSSLNEKLPETKEFEDPGCFENGKLLPLNVVGSMLCERNIPSSCELYIFCQEFSMLLVRHLPFIDVFAQHLPTVSQAKEFPSHCHLTWNNSSPTKRRLRARNTHSTQESWKQGWTHFLFWRACEYICILEDFSGYFEKICLHMMWSESKHLRKMFESRWSVFFPDHANVADPLSIRKFPCIDNSRLVSTFASGESKTSSIITHVTNFAEPLYIFVLCVVSQIFRLWTHLCLETNGFFMFVWIGILWDSVQYSNICFKHDIVKPWILPVMAVLSLSSLVTIIVILPHDWI